MENIHPPTLERGNIYWLRTEKLFGQENALKPLHPGLVVYIPGLPVSGARVMPGTTKLPSAKNRRKKNFLTLTPGHCRGIKRKGFFLLPFRTLPVSEFYFAPKLGELNKKGNKALKSFLLEKRLYQNES